MLHKIKRASTIRKDEGTIGLAIRALQKINRKAQKSSVAKKRPIHMLVKYEDVLRADWSVLPDHILNPKKNNKKSYKTAWLMSTPGATSGGHQNIFRFLNFLEKAGHEVKIYLYDNITTPTPVNELKKMLRNSPSYPNLRAKIVHYDSATGVDEDTDAIFATGWETAYPAFNDSSKARRFYFVQDFEPYFTAVGSEHVIAENTYRFGFYGITAGGWLAHKLKTEYGMQTDHFDFGAEKELYSYQNNQKRKEVFFYARPVTTRRGFELGIMALDLFSKQRPEYKITLAGWDVSEYDIPFKYSNLSNLTVDKLNAVYNRCAVGLVISLTNMSLLPLELLASGVIPVMNDGQNNRMVSGNHFIEYCDPSPKALADRMIELVDRKDLQTYSKKASESVASSGWDVSGKKFLTIFERVMHG